MTTPTTPSASLLANLRRDLARHAPFAQMLPQHLDGLISAAQQAYFAPNETVLAPHSGVVTHLWIVRQGSVTGRRGLADAAGGFHYEVGDVFPIAALMGQQAVSATYQANEDTFCLLVPARAVHALAAQSAPWADFLNRRVAQFLELSRQALQAAFASHTLAEQSLESALGTLPRKALASVALGTPLEHALRLMHDRRIGSVLVEDAQGLPCGILTRHDILSRVALPQRPLSTPIDEVMTTPLRTLNVSDTAQDAAMLMSRHGIRHVPVLEAGRVVNLVSERDLFALHRLSLKQLSTALRAAPSVTALQPLARDIRLFARNLLGLGVRARQLTELISHLNDVLTARLIELVAQQHGLDMRRACWLAFGSEGRSEQTIATDQDNGLVFESQAPERDRPAWLAMARAVNEALDACGYPLCKGQVMASNPALCLTPDEWMQRFAHWMEHGAPEDLLKASICFDLRPLAGRTELCQPLRTWITTQAPQVPRFMQQLALNALTHRAPLNWFGSIDVQRVAGREVIDLKLHGTALFVDAGRLYALAHGVAAIGTGPRLEAAGAAMGVEPQEREAWVSAFEFLQMLRLQVQFKGASAEAMASANGNPNGVDVAALNDIDRRMLKESLRVAQHLQQRMAMDYQR